MKLLMPRFQEKPLSFRLQRTVPQTNTGGQVENTKALERTRVKELGQNSTVTSGEGTLLLVKEHLELVAAAVTRWLGLFNKTQHSANTKVDV